MVDDDETRWRPRRWDDWVDTTTRPVCRGHPIQTFKPLKKRWGADRSPTTILQCDIPPNGRWTSHEDRRILITSVQQTDGSQWWRVWKLGGTHQRTDSEKFDHGFLSVIWHWNTRRSRSFRSEDYVTMNSQSWRRFDSCLQMKLEESSVTRGENPTTGSTTNDTVTVEDCTGQRYSDLTKNIRETIKEVVSSKKKTFRNGRHVSERTHKLFDERKVTYDKKTSRLTEHKKWNKTITRRSCRNDYREWWVSRLTERIGGFNKMGDTKEIYRGVKAVSDMRQTFSDTQPTRLENGNLIQKPQELAQVWSNFLTKNFEQTEQENCVQNSKRYQNVKMRQRISRGRNSKRQWNGWKSARRQEQTAFPRRSDKIQAW